MNQSELDPQIGEVVEVSWPERWQMYQRLQELDIPCSCSFHQPLRIEIANITTAMQLQSVLRQLKTPRTELACWLEHCLQLTEHFPNN